MKKLQILVVVLLVLLIAWQASPVSGCGPPGCPPGTGTPGYWKNHPGAWPVDTITIGGVEYCKDDAIEWMDGPVKGDKSITMFNALVAAKLNVLIGNPPCCVWCMEEADRWFAPEPDGFGCGPVGSSVRGSSECWQYSHGEKLYLWLDAYNNGELPCAPSRDALE
jgi:hypothetical protein